MVATKISWCTYAELADIDLETPQSERRRGDGLKSFKAFARFRRWSFKVKSLNTIVGKCCCTFACTNRYSKSGIPFYHFLTDPGKRCKWIAAVKHKDCMGTK